jgi:outer membrane lipoprotein carrier protein
MGRDARCGSSEVRLVSLGLLMVMFGGLAAGRGLAQAGGALNVGGEVPIRPDTVAASRAATPGEQLLRGFASHFRALATFEADFVQTQDWAGMDDAPLWKGKLYLRRPNLFRIEYTEPPGHLQVSDGKTVWTYVPENGEVLAARLDSTSGPGGDILRWVLDTGQAEPDVAQIQVEGKPALMVSLLPAAGLGLSKVRLWIRPGSLDLCQYEIIDSSGNSNLYLLSRAKGNPKLSDEFFRFTPPAGVPIVQLGSP